MSDWKPKRFWTEVALRPEAGGFAILLDGRPVRTPGKVPLVLPTEALAEAIAGEWRAVADLIDPGRMPLTRTANSAIEKVAPQRAEVAAMLTAYGETDLLCYRAPAPAGLARRQAEQWDPWLDWAADRYGARLLPAEGIMPLRQSEDALTRLAAEVAAFDPFRLAAFHDLVSLSGSLVLGLAVAEAALPAAEAWVLSRIDEDWQTEHWGEDDEARAAAGLRGAAFLDADRFFRLSIGRDAPAASDQTALD